MTSYISWDLTEDFTLDEEGYEIGLGEYALIEKVWVDPEERGKGVGKKLVLDAIEEIRDMHPDLDIKLAALPFGEGAMEMDELVAYYERIGFSVENCDGEAVIMIYR